MKRGLVGLLLALVLIIVSAPAVGANNLQSYDLIAGNPKNGTQIKVGTVNVSTSGGFLYVEYVLDDPTPADPRDDWWITEVHVQVVTNPANFTMTKDGNPIPGRFPYSRTFDPAILGLPGECVLQIPVPSGATGVYIAAHAAVMQLGGLEALAYSLPAQVTFKVTYPGPSSYFLMNILTPGFLYGTHTSWCVDIGRYIYPGQQYNANIYTSYEDLPPGTVDIPGNFDLVNWVLNQGYIGQPSPSGGTYTWQDVQAAIWALIDPDYPPNIGANATHVGEIVAAAMANGEGYIPGCNDVVAIVVVPIGPDPGVQTIIAQVTVAEVYIPCEGRDETAWTGTENISTTPSTYELPFPGRNWALYFYYAIL